MEMNHNWYEYLLATLWGVGFGVVGCLVRFARHGVVSLCWALSQLVAGGFCGWLVFMVMDGLPDVPPGWIASACGVAGGSGGMILDALQDRLVAQVRSFRIRGVRRRGQEGGQAGE